MSVVVVALALALALAACDPGQQERPEAIPTRDVPFQLMETTSSTIDVKTTDGGPVFIIYLTAGDRLVAANRSAEGAPDPAVVLRTLLEGPSTDEARLGILSAIPSSTRVRRITQHGSVLTIDLARDFLTRGTDSNIAVAQLVWTVTGLPGIESVRFRVAGTPVQVPTGGGSLAEDPVSRTDFPPLPL